MGNPRGRLFGFTVGFLVILLFVKDSLSARTLPDCICADALSQRPPLSALVKQVKSAVTTIHVYNDDGEVVSQGSGWFITERVVVSTRHTFWKEDMNNAAYAKVTSNAPNAQQYLVKSVLVDDLSYDIVLLEVLPVIPRGVSDYEPEQPVLEVNVELPEEAEEIFVISSPLGLPGVISTGIVSAVHNDFDLQVSAAVSTGSSGAPIFDYSGKVVGVVTGHLSTGQSLNFGLTVRALAAVIAKLRPILNEQPVTLGLPAPHRITFQNSPNFKSPGKTTRTNQQVQVYQQQIPIESHTQPVPDPHSGGNVLPGNFDKEIGEIETQREREWCYPTLTEWVNSQNARRQDQGPRKWWRGWKRYLSGLFIRNVTEGSRSNVNGSAAVNDTIEIPDELPSDPSGQTIVDHVTSPPQSPAPSTSSTPSTTSQKNHTSREYSPEILLEDIASLRLCTKRIPNRHLSSVLEQVELSAVDLGDGEEDEDLDMN